jgi:hypothetical protein
MADLVAGRKTCDQIAENPLVIRRQLVTGWDWPWLENPWKCTWFEAEERLDRTQERAGSSPPSSIDPGRQGGVYTQLEVIPLCKEDRALPRRA